MKKGFLIVSILFSFLFLAGKSAFAAASCKEFSATPNGSQVTVTANDCKPDGNYVIQIQDTQGNLVSVGGSPLADSLMVFNGSGTKIFSISQGSYNAVLFFSMEKVAQAPFTVQTTTYLRCGDPCNPNDSRCPSACPSVYEGGQWRCGTNGVTIAVPQTDIHGSCSQLEINTALGCIPTDTLNSFVGWFLSKLIFVASGIAFLLMAFGALQILTSAGSPEKVQAGKELITSALAGLIFIILSLFLLKLIGVDILQIPGFGK